MSPGPGLYIPHKFVGSADECEVCRNTKDHVVHLPTPENVEEPCSWCHGNKPPDSVVLPPCHHCHGIGVEPENPTFRIDRNLPPENVEKPT